MITRVVLHVDLTDRRTWEEPIDGEVRLGYLGARGLNAKLLWETLRPDVDPLGPENLLIFGVGALTGTHAPASGRTTITCKSPATDLYLKTNVGGGWGAALRFAGYDQLVIHGASEEPVYLWIDNGAVAFRSAGHLWGKDVRETDRLLKAELGTEELETAAIGQAGENLVAFAAVMCSVYNAAGRGGAGAVMGAKRLKAVVVRGWKPVGVAQPERFHQLAMATRRAIEEAAPSRMKHLYGTAGSVSAINELRAFPSYNFRRGYLEDAHSLSGQYMVARGYLRRRVACFSCPIGCHRYTEIREGPFAGTRTGGPEYETMSSLGAGCGVTDLEAVIKANELCNLLGLDTISAGSVIQWLMECVERGVVSEAEVDHLPVRWGNGRAVVALVEKIALREGVGDLLAQGVRRASEQVGKGSEKWAVQVKGLEQSRVETRSAKGYALAFAVNPRGPDHLHTQPIAEFGFRPAGVQLIERITGDAKYANPYLIEKRADIVIWHEDCFAITDALGFCSFLTTADFALDPEGMAGLFSAATGMEVDHEEIMRAGRRILTLEKCFNVREGATRADDRLPWRLMVEESPDRPGAINAPKELDRMLDEYYGLHGWDLSTSWPTRGTLEQLGLVDVAEELGQLKKLP